jgi:hypothetical protein
MCPTITPIPTTEVSLCWSRLKGIAEVYAGTADSREVLKEYWRQYFSPEHMAANHAAASERLLAAKN